VLISEILDEKFDALLRFQEAVKVLDNKHSNILFYVSLHVHSNFFETELNDEEETKAQSKVTPRKPRQK
jgi:hypothetical protein